MQIQIGFRLKTLALLTLILAISGPVSSQSILKLSEFHFGYYNQQIVSKPLVYKDFFEESGLKSKLPNGENYTNQLGESNLTQTGLYFGFDFNFLNKETKLSTPHYLHLGLQNGLIRSEEGFGRDNELFLLNSSTSTNPDYSVRLKAEWFGLNIGYNYQFLNRKRIKAWVGSTMLYEIAVSKKLNVSPIYNQNPTDTSSTNGAGIDHSFFLDHTPSVQLLPSIKSQIQVTSFMALCLNYQMGFGLYSVNQTSFSGRSRHLQIGLKFKI